MPGGGSAAESAPALPTEAEVATRIYRLVFGCFKYQHYCAKTEDNALNVLRNNEKKQLLHDLFISFTAGEKKSDFTTQWKTFTSDESSQVKPFLKIIPEGLKPLLAIIFRYSPTVYNPKSPDSDLDLRVRISVEHMLLEFLALLLHAIVLFNNQRPMEASKIAQELPLYRLGNDPKRAFNRAYSFLGWYTEERHEQKIFAELYKVSKNKETILGHLTEFYAALTEPITDELIVGYPNVFTHIEDNLQQHFKRWALEYFVVPQLTEFYESGHKKGGMAAIPVAFVRAALIIDSSLPWTHHGNKYDHKLVFNERHNQHYEHDDILGTKEMFPLKKRTSFHNMHRSKGYTKRSWEQMNLGNKFSYRFPKVATERLDAIAEYNRGFEDSDQDPDYVREMHYDARVQTSQHVKKHITESDDDETPKETLLAAKHKIEEQTKAQSAAHQETLLAAKREIEEQMRQQREDYKRRMDELRREWLEANRDITRKRPRTTSSFIDKTLRCNFS